MKRMLKDKKGVARRFLITFSILAVVLLLTGVLAQINASENSTGSEANTETNSDTVNDVAADKQPIAKDNIEKFIEDKNPEMDVTDVSNVDLNNPPQEIEIKEVKDTNLAIYEVDYTKAGVDDNLFVVSAAGLQTGKQDIVNYLQFGAVAESSNERFLQTATGVQTSEEAGYVMMREGSITGLSTNIEIIEGTAPVKITVLKNGNEVVLENYIDAEKGVKVDYDVQAKGIDTFLPGDVLSVKVISDDAKWKNVISMVEITQ